MVDLKMSLSIFFFFFFFFLQGNADSVKIISSNVRETVNIM